MNNRLLLSADLRRLEVAHAAAQPPLMQRAGSAAAAIAQQMLAGSAAPPLVVAGPGNNGGDAFVVARLLKAQGLAPVMLFAADPTRLPGDARKAHAEWIAVGGACTDTYPEGTFSLVVDGLFGIGLTRSIDGQYAEWIERINAGDVAVLSLDVPSGLNADTGSRTGPCVRADRTATFIASKPGLHTGDGPDFCGTITLCSLELDAGEAGGRMVETALYARQLKPRPRNSHKGSFGSLAILGGAPGMTGAALLAGRAALKLGAGRVYLGLIEPLAVDFLQPELMLRAPADAFACADTLAIGPGLGQSASALEWLERCVASPHPLVIDADALNLLARNQTLQSTLAVRPAPTLLTPHPAEAARLLGTTTEAVQSDRIGCARQLATQLKTSVALKGCGTVIALPDDEWFINPSGNPGLASAGSGDVLTGVLGALLAQGWPGDSALLAAVHLHGLAADACVAAGHGPVGLTAGQLADAVRKLLNDMILDSSR